MFENLNQMFGGMFGKITSGCCKLTMNGGIAVKTSNGYKTYNIKKGTLTNVTNFCFPVGEEFFFVIPTSKVEKGDIIIVDGKPKCVLSSDGKIISAIDYETSEVRQILPERHVFMGATYFYGKIVSLFGDNMLKGGKGIQKVMKMMMMSQMFGGKSFGSDNNGMMQMMMMSQMFGGGKGEDMFSDMFSAISFEENETETEDDESSNSED